MVTRCRKLWLYAVVLVTIAFEGGALAVDNPQVEYLSREAFSRIAFRTQGWGELGIDVCAHAAGQVPLTLRIGDKLYDRGLGTHAPGEMLVDLDGLYETFEAEAGLQWQSRSPGCGGSITMRVFVDDKLAFDSGVLHDTDAARPIRLTVKGAQELRLVVTDAGDGILCDCANWADARLTCDPSAAGRTVVDSFDAGRFARVVTCDPHRMDGAHSSRVQEFRAEDVFPETNLPVGPDGNFAVPAGPDGTGAVGLVWTEPRVLTRLELAFAPGTPAPSTTGVSAQAWVGQSIWQGEWKPIQGTIEVRDGRWVLPIDPEANAGTRAGWRKVRWVFPPLVAPLRVARPSAFTHSRWETADVRLELETPRPGERAAVEVYNGELTLADAATLSVSWDLAAPLDLHVRYTHPRQWKWDRTALRLRIPGADGQASAFAVALEDLVAHGSLYVPSAGFFATTLPAKQTLAGAKRACAGYQTVRQRVAAMPDQTFAQAWDHVHNPVQNLGPTMISLACDNRKFVVQREGMVQFNLVPDVPNPLTYSPQGFASELRPVFGSGDLTKLSRRVEDGWLPVPTATVRQGKMVYAQRAFVVAAEEAPAGVPGWLSRKPLCVVEFAIVNEADQPADSSLALSALIDVARSERAQATAVGRGAILHDGKQIAAFFDCTAAAPLTLSIDSAGASLRGQLPAGTTARCVALIPGWFVPTSSDADLAYRPQMLEDARAYWQGLLAGAAQIETPDQFLNDIIRASQVACLVAARNESDGACISPWIAADRYGPLESEANTIVRGMDLLGHHDFSRRALQYFVRRYSPAGFLTTGYTLMGTGWHLHSVGEHYQLTGDRDWLSGIAPQVSKVCEWIVRQRAMTKRVDEGTGKVPEYGLVPPGVTADWDLFAYRFYNQAFYCGGLRAAAEALQDVGSPGAPELVADASDFQRDLLRAYHWAQGNLPVLQSPSGAWFAPPATMLEAPGRVEEYYPGADGARSWAADVEIGPHHIAWLGAMDPNSAETSRMLDVLEDYWFLRTGMGDYDEASNHADWFSLGGFAKIQPYYGRTAELYAMRDEVKPFIRAYFNAIPSLLNPENMTFWEHFHNRGAWNKTHETGSFLSQTRLMFVLERGRELWLAPCITSGWLAEGQAVSVRNAPTRFGPVSYRVSSHVADGFLQAAVTVPSRTAPDVVVIRLRHPEGKRMQSVTVNGQAHTDFDPAREIVRIAGARGELDIVAHY
jgi:hypothetical protein